MFIRLYPFQKYELIAIDLNKQQLDADPKAIQINFTGNLTSAGDARMYSITEEAK